MKKIFFFILALTASMSLSAAVLINGVAYNLDEGTQTASVTDNITYTGEIQTGVEVTINYRNVFDIIIPETVTYNNVTYSVTSIGNGAFAQTYTSATLIRSIVIGANVTSIGNMAFIGCIVLDSIVCKAPTPPTCGADCFENVPKGISVYVPNGKVTNYSNTAGWSDFTNIKAYTIIDSGTCGAEGNNLTWELTSLGILTISGTGAMADYSNTNPWYDNRSSIKSVVIEAGVTSIGKYAFYNCENLTSVTIPGSVTSIGNYAFNKCSSLASVTIPEGVISIGPRAFQNCTSLTSIALPEGITSIGIRTFYQCTSLQSVTIPSSVTNINDEAFSGCNALTAITCKATTPPTCASNSFYAVSTSIPVYVPIGTVADYQAASVWSSFTNITDGTVASGNCGAEGDNLKWWLHSSGLLIIRGNGNMATWAQASAVPWYDHRSDIKSIELDEGVTGIGNYAFWNCTALTSITTKATTPPVCGTDCFLNVTKTIPLYVPDGKWANYHSADVWKEFTNIVDAANIASGTCGASGDNLRWVLSSDSVLTIYGTDAMADWATSSDVSWYSNKEAIKSAVIEAGATSIGKCAFIFCSKLASVTIPTGVTSIGDNAFRYCDGLTSMEVPEGIKSIGRNAFFYSDNLTSITIPNSVTSIGEDAFSSCKNLTSIIVGSGNTTYDSRDNCNAIIVTANDSLIAGCKNTNIPSTVKIIGEGAFTNSSLTSIVIPDNIQKISRSAFRDCTGMTSLTIGSGVTYIGRSAFSGCIGLTTITCKAIYPPMIENDASDCFQYVNKTIPLYVPQGKVSAYKNAPVWYEFTNIQEESATGIDTVTGNPSPVTEKVLRNGQLLIIRDGHMYNALGAEVR